MGVDLQSVWWRLGEQLWSLSLLWSKGDTLLFAAASAT